MRLDQNIFRGDVPRGASVPAENTDGIRHYEARRERRRRSTSTRPPSAGADAADAAAARRPTTPVAVGIHTTSARIVLPSPIAPKSDATLDVEWHYKLAGGPGQGHRMTFRWGDTLYQVAQWYPRVAVYDDLRGWDTDPYLGPSEFYNNFGRFDVSLDVPAGWIVGATGVLKNPDRGAHAGGARAPGARARVRLHAHDRRTERDRARVRRPPPAIGSSGTSSPTP